MKWLNWLNELIDEPDPVRLTFDDEWPMSHKIVVGILALVLVGLLFAVTYKNLGI